MARAGPAPRTAQVTGRRARCCNDVVALAALYGLKEATGRWDHCGPPIPFQLFALNDVTITLRPRRATTQSVILCIDGDATLMPLLAHFPKVTVEVMAPPQMQQALLAQPKPSTPSGLSSPSA
jgi:hypothetical protein